MVASRVKSQHGVFFSDCHFLVHASPTSVISLLVNASKLRRWVDMEEIKQSMCAMNPPLMQSSPSNRLIRLEQNQLIDEHLARQPINRSITQKRIECNSPRASHPHARQLFSDLDTTLCSDLDHGASSFDPSYYISSLQRWTPSTWRSAKVAFWLSGSAVMYYRFWNNELVIIGS